MLLEILQVSLRCSLLACPSRLVTARLATAFKPFGALGHARQERAEERNAYLKKNKPKADGLDSKVEGSLKRQAADVGVRY